MSIDLETLRRDTPACNSILHLNNAGASLMPEPVYKTMCAYLELEQEIGGYEAAAKSQEVINNFYTAFAALLNAHPNEIAFIENATRAWDMAVYAIPFENGDRVLIHATEYSSNYLALLQLSRTKGIEIDLVPSDPLGGIDCSALDHMVTPETKAIFLTHAPSHSGLVNPVASVGKIARRHNLIYVLDACQSVGQLPVDVAAIGCDVLCGTGRKFLRGPRGTGFLYVSRRILDDLHPPFVDLHSADWTSTHGYTLRADAKKFENYERFMAGQIALGAAAQYALDIGLSNIETRNLQLSGMLREQLDMIDGVTLRDQGERTSAIVTFEVDGIDATDIVTRLRRQKINVSAAKVEHARLDLEGRGVVTLVRASVHYYLSVEEVVQFSRAIRNIHL